MEFFNTRMGQTFLTVTVPSLAAELKELSAQIEMLNKSLIKSIEAVKDIETMAINLIKEEDLAEVVNTFSKDGWTFKQFIPGREDVFSNQLFNAVVIFERQVQSGGW